MKHRPLFFSFLILVSAVLIRGLLLEYSDLLDPTESRYASVSQEMVLSGDWTTPRLPMSEGIMPYMGKPPLHFWLTAGAYSLFGVDEWTARLPSWLASIAILLVVWSFGQRFYSKEVGVASALMAFSSGMLFFLAGASVVDVTLTALVTASTYSLYLLIRSNGAQWKLGYLSSFLMALAFLTKGPIAIVLVWLPILLWSLILKDFQWRKSIPWFSCFLVFLVFTTPWFVLNEIRNPGSILYFFWNENIARYLFKEYGDKYGSGHVHTYGFSWLILIAAFMPWSIVTAWTIYRNGWRRVINLLKTDRNSLFALMWGTSGAAFFTFVRQLHGMYVLPCIPGMALFCAVLFFENKENLPLHIFERLKSRNLQLVIFVISVVLIVAGVWLGFSSFALILGVALTAVGIMFLGKINEINTKMAAVQVLSVTSFLMYLLVIICLGPYIDERRSAGELLNDIADAAVLQKRVPQVGVMTKNSFSLFWTSKAWESELSRELHVRYVEAEQIPKNIGHVILRAKDASMLPELERKGFAFAKQQGDWKLYSRKNNNRSHLYPS
ncbi:MAG: glycosyltransferase family 39 protein [SAR324 cluster bacterium]|uniref:Glycosyltransferase family 39 protein n=1 Tax=SAR324 cluster bacterium TaxID=2024889 RepID=A0A7X9IJJ0_9DELT|nr:glycosyltransferase family 39 protein [SAR324 cluster bacterium]